MKLKIYIFLLLTILFFSATICCAQTNYYIDAVAGNDAGSGTIGAPWQNITKINSLTITAGSTINLKAGSVWTGQQLKFSGSGTLGNPIVINSYGSGAKPTLHGNGLIGEAVLYLYNQQHIEINNLEITNDPSGPNDANYFIGLYQSGNNPNGADRRGVMVAIDGYGTASHIYLKNLDIHHIKGQLGSSGNTINGAIPKRTGGIYFSVLGNTENAADKSRFDDVLIDVCNVYYCENTGLSFDNEWNVYYPGGELSAIPADQVEYSNWYNRRFSNIKVSNNILHHIGKNAMIIRCTDETGLIERNTCYETALGTTGNTMFTARAKGTIFQYNEGSFNRGTTQTIEPGGFDGSMYDPDYGSVGVIFQYSYSHDNSEGIYWGCNTRSLTTNTSGIPDPGDVGCTLRYCISQNDKGSLVFFNYPSKGNEIYNNVFYTKAGLSPTFIKENSTNEHTYNYYNNIIYNVSTNASYSFAATGQTRFISNNLFYYNRPASEPADPFKVTGNPFFINPGTGSTGINSLNGYKLQLGSPAISAGKLISNNGGLDYYANPVSSLSVPNCGAFQGVPLKSTAPIVVFLDSFTANNNTLATNANPALPPSGYYSNLPLTSLPSAKDSLNMLQFSNGSPAGLGYVTASDSNFLAPYDPVLALNTDSVYWSCNMWTKRSGASAISSSMTGSYGVATILACDNANPRATGAKGYGIFMLQSTWSTARFRFHLVYFTNGIDGVANTGSVNQTIIDTSVSITIAARYYSVRASYDPQTDKWQLAYRDDGPTAFADPASSATAYVVRPSITSGTAGTAIALKYFGFAYKYSITVPNNALFDQFKVEIVPQLQVLSSSATSLNFGNLLVLTQSASQLFNLSGTQLTGFPGTISIAAPSVNFQVSNNNSTWGATTTIAFSGTTLAATPVYVRFTPQTVAAFTGNLKAIGGGADTLYIPVTGAGVNTSIIGDPVYNTNTIFTFIAGQSVSIPFTTYGTLTAGNLFTAQLSNASGSFATPVAIGSLTSSTSGPLTITGTIPLTAIAGTGYLIRVIASTPVLTGTPNINNLTIIPPQSLPYAQNFSSLTAAVGTFTTYPAGWQAWRFNSNAIGTIAATDAPAIERSIKGGDASAISDSSYAYDFNGKIGFATGSVQNGLVLAINTTGYSNVGLSFDALTMKNPMTILDSVVAGLQLQYRVGGSGIFTLIPSYSLTEYKNINTAQTSGTAGQNIIAHLNITLPAACNNQNIVEIRWVMHRVSVVSGGSIKSSTCPTMAIDNVYVGLSTQTITPSNFMNGDAVVVPFTAAGVYTPANVYTAQLSDANGSFGSPINIGTLTSFASGAASISATIPTSIITGGGGYRIRVVSSTPLINGSDNGTNLTIVAIQTLPYAQDFALLTGSSTVFPAGWTGTLVSANPPSTAGRITDAIGNKFLVGATAADATNGVYDYNGKMGFLSSKTADNALSLSFTTLGYSGGIGISFDAMTIRNPWLGSPSADSILQALVLQYRVGSSGAFTAVSYLASEYVNNTTQQVSGTTAQKRVNGLFVTLPAACDNQPLVQLRWIARTVSGSTISTTTSQQPSFAIDNVYVGISTRAVASAAYSKTDTINVAFNAAGVYTAGNVFTVQLSNATGSFATPTAIGSIVSNASGLQTILATIPAGQANGSGYLIRVVSGTPYIIGTETGITVTVSSAYYYKGAGNFSDVK